MGLEAAQAAGLIGSSVLWEGQAVTLVGVNGADAYIETSDSSRSVSLDELDLVEDSSRLVSRNDHFTSPGVFRPQPAEAAVCSAEEHDYSLDSSMDPGTDEGLRHCLRQAASGDRRQRELGLNALREEARRARAEGCEEEFKRRVRLALDEIGREDFLESLNAQQAYNEVQNSLPPVREGNGASSGSGNGTSHSNGSAGGGGSCAPRSGAAVVSVGPDGATLSRAIAANGASVVSGAAFGEAGDAALAVTAGGLPGDPDPSLPALSGPGGSRRDGEEVSDGLPALVSAASVAANVDPFTFDVPAFLSSASIGALEAPRGPDAGSELKFFESFFVPRLAEGPSTEALQVLVRSVPDLAFGFRSALAKVVREYNATYRFRQAGPADRDAALPIQVRYDSARRRFEVSLDPAGSAGNETLVSLGLGGRSREGGRWSDYRGPFGGNLSIFPIGSDRHRRGEGFGPIVAYAPIPQYLQGVRLGDGAPASRADGRATDRTIDRVARRDSARDDHGRGSHSGDREGRGSRGGHGGGRGGRHGEDPYAPFYEEDLDSAAA